MPTYSQLSITQYLFVYRINNLSSFYTVYMYVFSQHFQQSMDQPGMMVANLARGEVNWEMNLLLFLFVLENLALRDRFGRHVT